MRAELLPRPLAGGLKRDQVEPVPVLTGEIDVEGVQRRGLGAQVADVKAHLEAVAVSLTEARQLDMHRGDPALLLHDVIADEDLAKAQKYSAAKAVFPFITGPSRDRAFKLIQDLHPQLARRRKN